MLSTQENFKVCLEKGVYGGIHSEISAKSKQMNAEVIAGFTGIKTGDYIFLYVRNIGIYGLWRVKSEAFYDKTKIWPGPNQLYPYRICFEPIVREFNKPVALSDILDLRDKGRIWTFDMATFVKKSHHPITTDEGKEIIRLLLRNNPIYSPIKLMGNQYIPDRKQIKIISIDLSCDKNGCLKYEGYLNAWFMHSFAQGALKEFIGDYSDFLNYVPTSFNKVMDIFLTHMTNVDGVNILHKFTCIELKTGKVNEEDLNQIIMYENWLIRKLAQGDSEMVQAILVGFEFDDKVVEYRNKRRAIEEKTIRLIKYKVKVDKSDIILSEI